jgi:hypothetical protein
MEDWDQDPDYQAWWRSRAGTPLWKRPPDPPKQKLNKLEYDQHLEKLGFKRGDHIVSNYIVDHKFYETQMYVVDDIQEIHYLADYEADNKPKCILIRPLIQVYPGSPTNPWWVDGTRYHKVPEDAVIIKSNQS